MKRLAAILKAKDWREQVKLAENKEPGTEFDRWFTEAKMALELLDKPIPAFAAQSKEEAKARLTRIGFYFANLFQERDGGHTLNEMAAALNVWHRHKTKRKNPDAIRATLIALSGMFPPGQPRHEMVRGKLVNGKPWPMLTTRVVIKNLQLQGVDTKKGHASIRKAIQREARRLRIVLDATPGQPKRKIATKTLKKVGFRLNTSHSN